MSCCGSAKNSECASTVPGHRCAATRKRRWRSLMTSANAEQGRGSPPSCFGIRLSRGSSETEKKNKENKRSKHPVTRIADARMTQLRPGILRPRALRSIAALTFDAFSRYLTPLTHKIKPPKWVSRVHTSPLRMQKRLANSLGMMIIFASIPSTTQASRSYVIGKPTSHLYSKRK